MRISIDDLEKYYRHSERESNGAYATKPQHERKNADPQLNCTVYEIRLPRFSNEKDARKCFTRLGKTEKILGINSVGISNFLSSNMKEKEYPALI